MEAIAIEAVMTLHGLGMNIVQTTAIQISVSIPVCKSRSRRFEKKA